VSEPPSQLGPARHAHRVRGRRLVERRTLVHVHPRPDTTPAPAPLPQPQPKHSWRFWLVLAYLVTLAASHAVTLMKPPPPPVPGAKTVTVTSPTQGAPDERVAYLEWTPDRDIASPRAMAPMGAMATSSSLWSDSPTQTTSALTPNIPTSDFPVPTSRPPVLLIHGSPGRASLFDKLAPLIAEHGYRVIAVDLPGFGDSSRDIEDHSMLAHSRRIAQLLDQLHITRAHVVGWSNGGGVVLHLADALKDRVASLTLLAAVGDQKVEGSGSYTLEHVKYAIGFAGFAIPDLLPHFGHYDTYTRRTAFLRNFWDSDQRPLRAIMKRLTAPTLIVHGRRDCMLPVKAAFHHHATVDNSSLALLDANHFLPLTHPAQTASVLVPFFQRHDQPGTPEPRTVTDAAVPTMADVPLQYFYWAADRLEPQHWSVHVLVIAALSLLSPTLGAAIAGGLVTIYCTDYLVAAIGVLAGALLQIPLAPLLARVFRRYFRPLPPRLAALRLAKPASAGWLSAFVPGYRERLLVSCSQQCRGAARVKFVLAHALALVPLTLLWYGLALAAFISLYRLDSSVTSLAFVLVLTLVGIAQHVLTLALTRRGRMRLIALAERIRHYEYWPMWAFYAPLVPYICWLMLKHRGMTLITCCNPGIENGGGLIGESKHAIMRSLGDHPAVLPTPLIDTAPPEDRLRQLRAAMQRAELSYPVILKPDAGQRGFGVALVHNEPEAAAYFAGMTSRAVVQPYAEGPHECGVLWARHPRSPASDGTTGFIFSITRKDFATITGDGVRTLEELILSHPRFRRQADVFLDRLADRAADILPAGETLRLGVAGNHCQGALFRDGADLITPELSRAIDTLAASFKGDNGGALDFGRFDLRYESDDQLRRGEAFSIVELNGTTSESTNLYDPSKNIVWAYQVLFAQWKLLFELGAHRRAQGACPMGLRTLVSTVARHYLTRRGSAISS